jgi:hypothetical protein
MMKAAGPQLALANPASPWSSCWQFSEKLEDVRGREALPGTAWLRASLSWKQAVLQCVSPASHTHLKDKHRQADFGVPQLWWKWGTHSRGSVHPRLLSEPRGTSSQWTPASFVLAACLWVINLLPVICHTWLTVSSYQAWKGGKTSGQDAVGGRDWTPPIPGAWLSAVQLGCVQGVLLWD